jgi:hypothetical protein
MPHFIYVCQIILQVEKNELLVLGLYKFNGFKSFCTCIYAVICSIKQDVDVKCVECVTKASRFGKILKEIILKV